MPFTNEVIGTNGVLIRNWLQSANYVPGVSGWQITKDGNSEFNNGTFRGSIEVGPLTGQHFIVNNSATGDVVDVYDSSNTLVAEINRSGEIITSDGTYSAIMFHSGYSFTNFGSPPGSQGGMTGSSSSSRSEVVIDSGRTVGGFSSNIFLQDDINGPSGNPLLTATQRKMGQGALIQTDSYSPNNNYFHPGSYSGTTDVNGNLTITHGATFTPVDAVITGTAHGGSFANLTWGYNGANSSTFNTNWTIANTGAPWANRFITFSALFWG
jgi:hypothetical protein